VPVPVIDESKCSGCGLCGKICQYSAVVCLGTRALTFPELCHGCGGCMRVCPEGAICEEKREVGVVEKGRAGALGFLHGRLRVGEAMSPPLMREVKELVAADGTTIIDVPPGTSCPVVTAVQGCDFVVLVTEPTPFGLNDLELALRMVEELELPHGVVVNRHEDGNTRAREFCERQRVAILAEIPDDRRVAEAYSNGLLACDAVLGYDAYVTQLWQRIQRQARKGHRRSRRVSTVPEELHTS
jgi:MinD superfamily P-loop ATPase